MYEQDMRANIGEDEAPILEIRGLARSFGSLKVISHFDLTVRRGERIALRGPNGSGKTTILRCIGGTLDPSAGSVRVRGHAAGSFEARTETGPSLSLERSFYRRLSAFENLVFFARLRHISKKRAVENVREIAEELKLNDILKRRVDRCSTGMLQQLSVARALMGNPSLLLLDEPTRSLDEAAIGRIWDSIERRDCAVLIASHVTSDVERCSQVRDLPT